MKKFNKSAQVFRIGMKHWSKKKRRFWVGITMEEYAKLNIIEIESLETELMFI